MKYAIKFTHPDKTDPDILFIKYMTDAFGEVLVFDNPIDARAYAEKHIDEGMTLQIVEV
jgi:hypothetical protein